MDELENQIKSFTSQIVNRSNNANDIRKNVLDYKKFLINTKLITKNSEISKWLDVVINSSKILNGFKESDGFVDVETFVVSIGIYYSKSNDVESDKKHYGHYHTSVSDACTSSVSNDSCGSSYERKRRIDSSSCGSTYTTSSSC
jgi:hypothetical protein